MKTCSSSTLLVLLLLGSPGCSSSSSTSPAGDDGGVKRPAGLDVPSPVWEEQIIYFVLTDRFANGDKTNDDQHKGEFDPGNIDKYSGGDLQGIIDQLDYIQGLGATAIWITPPVANMWWDPLQQSGGYHGYWARDLRKVDEHQGTLETYQKLSIALHQRGMYLIQDVVPNHMGNFFTYSAYDPADVSKGFVKNSGATPGGKPEQPPFDQNDATDAAQRAAGAFHWTPAISDYNSRQQELTYQISDLDDINTENPAVQAVLKKSYGDWIRNVGVDAFRVDTVKFIDHPFWYDFFHAADGIMATARATGRNDFFAFGEVYEIPAPLDDTQEKKVASYLGTADKPELPANLGYPLYGEIGRVFANGKPTSFMTYRLGKLTDPSLYPKYVRTPTFIDDHDVARFLSSSTDAAMAQALAFLFTIPGIPIVYYGTEQRFTETRAAMFAGGFKSSNDHFDTSAAFYRKLQKLAALRTGSKTLTHGTLSVVYDSEAGPGPLAFLRSYQGDTVLVIFNTAEENVLIAGLDSKLPEGTVLEQLFADGAMGPPDLPVVGKGGLVQTVLPRRSVMVAHATARTVPPSPPATTITVDTPIEGQTFTQDVTFTGTVSPKDARVVMLLDGYFDRPQSAAVAGDGTWKVTLGVSGFPTGTARHAVSFYSPDGHAATTPRRFTTSVVFSGTPIVVNDPAGDDKGPSGSYRYPMDQTFGHQGDITSVRIEAGPTTMAVKVTMADWTTVWNPPNGFDHVAFSIFLSLPGKPSATALPLLNASFPGGGSWSHDMFAYGWGSPAMWSAEGATASKYGALVAGPALTIDAPSKTVTFTFDRRSYGAASWSGAKVYVTTWDFDGIKAVLRPLTAPGGQWWFGGGGAPFDKGNCYSDTMPPTCESLDPKILDDVAPIAIP